MRLRRTEVIAKIPGSSQTTRRNTAEWICPDCDYFEETEDVKA